uniref:NSL1 component of MIS12 kinetochore complex n=1 Tax=Fundulus heteroclitus TaxID=8078 RepID=A0A3Q2QLF1_FUNHE
PPPCRSTERFSAPPADPRLRLLRAALRGDEGRRLKRREKNRVAAQKSRKRQTQRADQLHQTCELLEQRNRKLKREVDSLSEEQNLLTEALSAHEPFCCLHCMLGTVRPLFHLFSASRKLRLVF